MTVHSAGDRRIRRASRNVVDRGKLQHSEKTTPIMTLSTTDSTYIVVQLNPDLRSVRPQTTPLSCGNDGRKVHGKEM